MNSIRYQSVVRILIVLISLSLWSAAPAGAQEAVVSESQIAALVDRYVADHGESDRARFERGVRQAAALWRESDGSADKFDQFCLDNFIADPDVLSQTTARLEAAFESIDGHFGEMGRDLDWNLSVETGPILPIDHALGRYSPWSHASEDMFETGIAFSVLLNYPLYSLKERLELGPSWSRAQWAEARLAERFRDRVPTEASKPLRDAHQEADNYLRDYYIWMHHLLDANGARLFPDSLRLITHWNLRDELKSQYAEPDGLARQEMIYELMLRIVRQDIPRVVINNPAVDWEISTNDVSVSPVSDGPAAAGWKSPGTPGERVDNTPEPDTRYACLLDIFKGMRAVDKYYPTMPTLIDRRFERNREIPEAEVERLFTSVLSADVVADIARVIESRLGRQLRPFDIWYDGFKTRAQIGEDRLDSVVRSVYPTAAAFDAGLPELLGKLGFDKATAAFLADRIEVDPSRGAGHAAGPGRSTDNAHLRTHVSAGGMDYKGYNIAVHELGHNVEQVFSTCRMDHWSLGGVPNTAFTEAFAFVFQSRDLELLGLESLEDSTAHLKVLDQLWGTYEIAGVSLVDMRIWHWMYAHPDATPAELKQAVIAIAREVWNEYFAPVLGTRDSEILAVYTHIISSSLYLPDYAIGALIEFQLERHLETNNLASEMERMCRIGSVTPGFWMQQAVGAPISAEPMLAGAREALAALQK